MTKFEYIWKPVSRQPNGQPDLNFLQDYGQKGWELVSITEGLAVFKRPLAEVSGNPLKSAADLTSDNETDRLADQRIAAAMREFNGDHSCMALVWTISTYRGTLPGVTPVEHYNHMLRALYRYYKRNPSEEIEFYYMATLGMLGGLTAGMVEVGELFAVLRTELELKNQGVSPFSPYLVDNVVRELVQWVKTEPAIYENSRRISQFRANLDYLEKHYNFQYEKV